MICENATTKIGFGAWHATVAKKQKLLMYLKSKTSFDLKFCIKACEWKSTTEILIFLTQLTVDIKLSVNKLFMIGF